MDETTSLTDKPAEGASPFGNGPPPVFRRNTGYQTVPLADPDDDDDDNDAPRYRRKNRSFCQSWCEIWFLVAQSRVSCIAFTVLMFVAGTSLILVTSLGGIVHCPPLTGGAIVTLIFAILSISLACMCCGYHWVKDDDDLPFAIFCAAYCLLLLFIFTTAAGTAVVFTHFDTITNGTYVQGNETVHCSMSELPLASLMLAYATGIVCCVIAYFAFFLAMGATRDVK